MEAIEMFADAGTKDLDFAAALEQDQKSGWFLDSSVQLWKFGFSQKVEQFW